MRIFDFKQLNSMVIAMMAFSLLIMISCKKDDDPVKENIPELITKATLVFTPDGGGTAVTVSATDPDGEGVKDITVDGSINLIADTTYTLTIELINALVKSTDEGYNISEEVKEEDDEHMFFFSWTNNVFSEPKGNGNIDNRADTVNYEDKDDNDLPLGLKTKWTAGPASSGTFRVVLKHQPDLKTAVSDVNTGDSDLDVSFEINVK